MSSSTISPLNYTQTNQPSSSSSTSGAPGGVVANESTFLTLLVAQLKNQDPLSPSDSTQFIGELAQFSSLEQLTNINQNVGTLVNGKTVTTAPGTTSGSSSNQTTSSNGIS